MGFLKGYSKGVDMRRSKRDGTVGTDCFCDVCGEPMNGLGKIVNSSYVAKGKLKRAYAECCHLCWQNTYDRLVAADSYSDESLPSAKDTFCLVVRSSVFRTVFPSVSFASENRRLIMGGKG